MKTIPLMAATLLSLWGTTQARADVLGIYVGAQAWQNEGSGGYAETTGSGNTRLQSFSYDEETNGSLYIHFEHPLPLIPNIRARVGKMTTDGNTRLNQDFTFNNQTYQAFETLNTDVDFTNTDITLYYELLDNDLVGLDLGVTAKYLSGDFMVENEQQVRSRQEASLWIPMGYVAAKIALPGTGLYAFGDINAVSYDDNTLHDYQFGLGYHVIDTIAVDASVRLGYREVALELDDVDNISADLEFNGVFAGIEVHF